LQLILDILIADQPGENKMWAEEARSLATGLLLWLYQSDRPFTLSELSAMVKGQNLDDFLTKVIAECVVADNLISIDHAAYMAIQNFLQKAEKEQSGVRSTLTGMLRLWEDPLVCAATDCSDVDFRDMRKEPISLYLSFGTNQISRLAPLINLIVQLFLNVMLDTIPGDDEPHKVLCLLDEINRFGKMDKLKDGFGDLAGYGVHLLPIIQNLGQFYSTYGGRDESDIFFQNTDLKICFSQNAATDKEFVSSELGNKTIRIKTRSYSSQHNGSNYNESFVERPLLTPQEVLKFSKKHQILITSEGIVKCKKIVYYEDDFFKSKLLPAIDIPTVTPSTPIIDIKKSELGADDKELIANADKEKRRQEQIKDQQVGKAISESLAPIIARATTTIEAKEPVFIDKATGEVFNDIAQSFDEEEDNQ
jgi:type IV secretion system protein VirD4